MYTPEHAASSENTINFEQMSVKKTGNIIYDHKNTDNIIYAYKYLYAYEALSVNVSSLTAPAHSKYLFNLNSHPRNPIFYRKKIPYSPHQDQSITESNSFQDQ